MLHESPLRERHQTYVRAHGGQAGTTAAAAHRPGAATGTRLAPDLEYIPYGLADQQTEPACQLVADFGDVQPEYAAIRRGAAVLDSPHRGTLLITGKDRRDFLNRMVTQELKDLARGVAKQAFWLNRKGRIDADLLLVELGDQLLVDLDINQAAHTVKTLSEFVFSEDVEIKDVSSRYHHIAVHGKLAAQVLTAAAANGSGIDRLGPLRALSITIANVPLVIAHRDQTAEPGYELFIPYDQAVSVWDALIERGDLPSGASHRGLSSAAVARPIGWHAFNIARIEAGTPLFNIDFGPTNLPHETGLLSERVSFTKGCYLGQEVVARLENLGKPKQILVGLRVHSDSLPIAGAQVFERNNDNSMGDQIGVVTSSTLSPMLGAVPIAFAMLKTAKAAPGATVLVNAEGEQASAVISPLRFWPRETDARS
ncbi:MAG: hypothetical protein L0Y44_06360 [Phycisphaerales bacterium]|nr:hypothetical protein [Phycisphaerales bacterium]MCI0630262.1 hypothetical protein [Phycisphaerales bacterium]MCI0676697.1 hypothetical protein [Phycisphaerales bacterium]